MIYYHAIFTRLRKHMAFHYEILATDGRARAGILHTPHGSGILHTPHGPVPTPVFAPVGTVATVKAVMPRDLHEMNASLVLANTYHLHLRPGSELVRDLGGLHQFMAWPGPILTDSGGFQVFSLAEINKIDDQGVTFRSHLDGSTHRFTPERSMQIQENLGADIIMAFDQCPTPTDRAIVETAPLSKPLLSAPAPGQYAAGRLILRMRHRRFLVLCRVESLKTCGSARLPSSPRNSTFPVMRLGAWQLARASQRCTAHWTSAYPCCRLISHAI